MSRVYMNKTSWSKFSSCKTFIYNYVERI